MKKCIALLVVCLGAFAQNPGTPVNQVQGPGFIATQNVLEYSGTNLILSCWSPSRVTSGRRVNTQVSITAASNANPVSLTSTAHGFHASSRPSVTISGGTGNWTAINGTFTATITGANTFTIPVDSTTFGALTGTIVFTTTAPRTVVAEWAVQDLAYDGSNNLIWAGWRGGTEAFNQVCAQSTTANRQ